MDDPQALLQALSLHGLQSRSKLGSLLGWHQDRVTASLQDLTSSGVKVATTGDGGLELPKAAEALDPARIRATLSKESAALLTGLDVCFRVDSTNNWLKQRSPGVAGGVRAALAEYQTDGRGRRGRPWVSPPLTNIYLSLSRCYAAPIPDLSGLSLALGVAATRAIADIGAPTPDIKWPNDLYWQDRKLGGILVELVHRAAGRRGAGGLQVIVGIGINTEVPAQMAAAIDQQWTDLVAITGQSVPRNRLAGRLIDQLLLTLDRFASTGLAPWQDEFASRDMLNRRAVRLLRADGGRIDGIACGIDQRGALRVETPGGTHSYQTGEVSVRLSPATADTIAQAPRT